MIRHDKCKFTRLPGPYCALIGSELTASNIVPVWRNRVKIPSLLWRQMPPSFENHETRTRFQSVAQPNMAIQNGAYPKSSHNQLVDHHGSHYHTNSWNRIIIKYRICFSLVIYGGMFWLMSKPISLSYHMIQYATVRPSACNSPK